MIYINTIFLEWFEKNGRIMSFDPTAGKVQAPRGPKKRGTRYAPGAY